MVVTYIEGGLGNMLFQLCFSYAKAKENNTTFHTLNYRENLDIIKDKHKADIESYEKTILRNFSISPPPLLYQAQIQHFCPFNFEEIPYEPDCYNLYKGYFQSEKYFEKSQEDLAQIFQPTEEIIDYMKEKYPFLFTLDCVALHIRRGDYLQLPNHHPIVPTDHYHKALKKLGDFEKILVFTNDMDWCYKNFVESRAIFIEESDWMSLYLMSFCTKHVIANSSFSWWGAKLAEMFFPEKNIEVVAPPVWFGPAVDGDEKDLVPSRWMKV
jgi:hypothetical protein